MHNPDTQKFSHTFSLPFSVETHQAGDAMMPAKLLEGLEARVRELRENYETQRNLGQPEQSDIIKACGKPLDSYAIFDEADEHVTTADHWGEPCATLNKRMFYGYAIVHGNPSITPEECQTLTISGVSITPLGVEKDNESPDFFAVYANKSGHSDCVCEFLTHKDAVTYARQVWRDMLEIKVHDEFQAEQRCKCASTCKSATPTAKN